MKKKKITILFIIIFLIISIDILIINITSSHIDNMKNNAIMSSLITLTNTNGELLNVDMIPLKEKNADTVGWIEVNGTNINYPVVQSNDNSYYLNHSFDKSKNSAGWIFLDYRNDLANMNKNTIIYGHSRLDNTMFGMLKNILNSDWIEDENNYYINLSTEYGNTLWQVFSVYKIPTTSDYLVTKFSSDKSFLEFISMLINRSDYNFNTTVSKGDYILTLSTCSGNYAKLVMHAKLIKREIK